MRTCYITGRSLIQLLGLGDANRLYYTMYYMASKTYEADKNKFFFSPLNNTTTTDIYKAF